MRTKQTLRSRNRRSGRFKAALLLFLAAAAVAVMAARGAQANTSQMIGLDMTPASGNQVAASGVNTCAQVDVGDSFEADVFATNLDSLTAYEFRVNFDPAIIEFDRDSVDFNFLLAKDGGSAQFPLVEEESAGRWFIGAADTSHPDSGSGTLARLRFTTLKKGTSTLSIAANPVVLGPRLTGAGGVSVGDEDGDAIWDGQLSSGKVAVGVSCAGATPIITPAPTHVPNKSPGPTGSATTPAGGSGVSPAPTAAGAAADGSGGSGDAPSATSPGIVENVGAGGGQSSPTRAPGNAQDPDNNSGDEDSPTNQGKSGESSSTSTVVLVVIAATLMVAGAMSLLWLRRSAGSAR